MSFVADCIDCRMKSCALQSFHIVQSAEIPPAFMNACQVLQGRREVGMNTNCFADAIFILGSLSSPLFVVKTLDVKVEVHTCVERDDK